MSPGGDDNDASPSPDSCEHDQDGIEMTEQKHGRSSADPSHAHAHAKGGDKKITDPKDPLRPRRKKARRACFACQRAHLTCGDERPCQRCIKRGLQDACHDGVRKKAKYLHDAPTEALLPGIAGQYHHPSGTTCSPLAGSQPAAGSAASILPLAAPQLYPSPGRPSYDMYSQPLNVAQAGPLIPDNGVMGDFGGSQASLSPRFIPGVSQEAASVQALPSSISHSQPDLQAMNHFGGSLYDPNDSALFNFDIAGLNFLNRYGALELGMLGHMSSGMAETPPNDSNTAIAADSASGGFPATVTTSSAYSASPGTSDPVFRPTELPLVDWQSTSARQTSLPQLHDTLPPAAEQQRRHDAYKPVIPNAYAIGAGLSSLAGASPTSLRQEVNAPGYDDGSGAAAFAAYSGHQQDHEQQPIYDGPGRFTQPPHPDGKQPGDNNLTLSTLQAQNSASRKRRLDASSIYKSVKQPYSYTTGFHSLTAFLQRRFSPQKTLRIAKALASIRPSFISCTKSLNRDDLVFMEKCFQRTLWEYEDFINAYGTPTIICRRTGEVAAVSKEFSLLTGWRRDVLLGKEPNLNVNTGGTPYSQQDAPGSRGGQSTPCPPNASIPAASEPDSSQSQQQLQPVFLAELLDDDSVIRFYEDFAKLAFGDSRGSVMAPCKLLSYRTKDDIECGTDGTQPDSNANSGHGRDASPLVNGGKDSGHRQGPSQPDASQGADRISSDSVMTALGKRDGKVDCMYCWTVKRDVFQVPMLIVMNFLPCI